MTTKVADIVRAFMPWSHSKISLAEKCPRAFEFRYVRHTASKEGTEARVGTAAHVYLENRLDAVNTDAAQDRAEKAVKALTTKEIETLKERNQQSEAYVSRTSAFRDRSLVRHEGLEVRLAITPRGEGCGYEDGDALIRGSVDHLIEQHDGKALVIDHKSGRTHELSYYRPQLDTYQVLAVQNRRHLSFTQAGVHHIQDGSLVWQRSASRAQVQRVLLPWLIRRIEIAAARLQGYPAKTSPLCAWCDYHSSCPEGIALISVEDALRKRTRKAGGAKMKKDGTPRAPRAKKAPIAHERPEDIVSVSELLPDYDDELIL